MRKCIPALMRFNFVGFMQTLKNNKLVVANVWDAELIAKIENGDAILQFYGEHDNVIDLKCDKKQWTSSLHNFNIN